MSDLEKKVKAITAQVAIARKAVTDLDGAAEAGINPTGVWLAATKVCDIAVRELNALHTEQQRRAMASNRNAGNAAVKRFAAKHGTQS